MAEIFVEVPKRSRNSRKALKEKNTPTNEAFGINVLPAKVTDASATPDPALTDGVVNENHDSLPQPKKGGKAASKKLHSKPSYEKELLEMQEMMHKLRLEKEKTEELLKAKDEILKQKEEEQEKLQIELKKLHKLKEFKPTMNLPVLKDKEHEKKGKKKNGCTEKKRPSPPYILWCKDQWIEIKKENPDAKFKDISNMLGAKWKTVSAEEKKPYEEKYQVEKEAYLRVVAQEKREGEAMKLLEEEQKQKTAMELLEQYIQFKQGTEKDDKKKKKKKEKDPLKPKHPASAFFLFTNDRRAALLAENMSVLEVSKITAEEWKNMSQEQKRPYEEMAKQNKEKYIQEMEAYKQMKDEEAAILKKEEEEYLKLQKQEALQLLKKKEKTENLIKKTRKNHQKKNRDKNSDPNRPKKPASSFLQFSKEARKRLQEERPGINNPTLNALVSVKWKELGEEERRVWNNKAAEAMNAYKKEVEEYNKVAAASLAVKAEE